MKTGLSLLVIGILIGAIGCAVNRQGTQSAKAALLKSISLFPEDRYGAIENYQIRVVEHTEEFMEPKGPCWIVGFTKPVGSVGSFFMVVVSRTNGTTRFVEGK